jgi:hypothetical protein
MLDDWLPPLSPRARALLAAERGQKESEALKARAVERAQAVLDGERWSGIALRQEEGRKLFGLRSRAARVALLAAAAMAFAGLAVAGARLVWREPEVTTRLPAPVERPSSVTPRARSVGARGLAASDAVVNPSAESPAPSAPAAPQRAHLSAPRQYEVELGLLEPARASMARGEYNAALGAIAQHQREYPNGQLTQEREALRVRALWGLGQRPAAEAAAARFRKRYPRSGLLNWMKATPPP